MALCMDGVWILLLQNQNFKQRKRKLQDEIINWLIHAHATVACKGESTWDEIISIDYIYRHKFMFSQ